MSSRYSRSSLALAGCLMASGASAQLESTTLDAIVVTATGRPERQSQIAGTTQVIDRERIEHSPAKSITDLLAENAVGFFSEWTPGQTSINIRGGASDGQGKDFRSQVAVLINGRRAGTANLSKLSLADVERIEIVRGPASVIYGSQNIGGVINIIMKTGRTASGTLLEGTTGAWNLAQGRAQTGGVYEGFDYYLGVSGGKRDDYSVGGSGRREINTSWNRGGALGAFGWQLNPDHRIDVQIRQDGIYDAGFRGSGANYLSRDNRFNGSLEASYSGQTPGAEASWFMQFYAVGDTDRFKWASPVVRNGNVPGPGTAVDFNRRDLDIFGTRVQPRFQLWEGNDLLLGFDWEQSQLRNDRFRRGVPGNNLAQVSPQDNNETDGFKALYLEDTQRLFDDRLTIRGGVRQTWGTTQFEPTPNLAGAVQRVRNYQATTYSTGATLKVTDWLGLRVGASSGFRAPTATELAADYKGSLTVATANTHNVERVYRYQAGLGTRFGTVGTPHDWTIQVQSVIRGPIYYNTEENLLVPAGEPYREFIWKKNAFAVWNVRGEVALAPGVQLYLQVNNLFDVNNHPIFIANDKVPVIADLRFYNGGIGTSMPGRDVQVGVQARF